MTGFKMGQKGEEAKERSLLVIALGDGPYVPSLGVKVSVTKQMPASGNEGQCPFLHRGGC